MVKELRLTCPGCGNNEFEIVIRQEENLNFHIDMPCTACGGQPLEGEVGPTFEDIIMRLLSEKE